MTPSKKSLLAMADKLHRDTCWRGPSCDDFTREDLHYAEALWWFLSTPQPTGQLPLG